MTLDTLLSTAEISNVIWIDDKTGHQTSDFLKSRIKEILVQLKALEQEPVHELLGPPSTMSGLLDDLESSDSYTQTLERLSDPELETLLTALQAQLDGQQIALPQSSPDFTDVEIQKLILALGNRVQPYTPEKWSAVKDDVLPSCKNKNTLFLIDQNFGDDNGPYSSGNEVLGEILEKTESTPICIMFSRQVAAGREEEFRDEVYREISVQHPTSRKSQFSVMSKSAVGDANPDAVDASDMPKRFTTALRIVVTHRLCHRLAESTAQTMTSRLTSAVDDLASLPITDIDRAVFSNPFLDGSSELDVVIRILNLYCRVAVQDHFSSENSWFKDIQIVRSLISISPTLSSSTSSSVLSRWRHQEVIDSGEYINRTHSPLQCGDLFEVSLVGKPSRIYVLLAPPCDLAVRRFGERKLKQGTLVEIVKSRQDRQNGGHGVSINDDGSGRYYEVKGISVASEHPLILDSRQVFYVSLDHLDYVVFSPMGHAELTRHSQPPDALLPGYTLRFKTAQGKLNKSTIPFCLDSALKVTSHWDLPTEKSSFNIRRIGRVRDSYAQALFAAFTSFQTRAAFELDFARETKPRTSNEHPVSNGDNASSNANFSGVSLEPQRTAISGESSVT